jgi:hypothetical protein
MFLTSFFGGPGAAAAIIAVSSYRLRRVIRDLPLLIILLLAPLGFIAWLRLSPAAISLREWTATHVGNSGYTLLYRALGLLCFGIGYWMHAREHRNSELLGLKAPNGWWVGLPCLAIGYGLMVLALAAMDAVAGKTG